MVTITKLSKKLGLRGMILRGGENWRTAEIDGFNNKIQEINKRHVSKHVIRKQKDELLELDI